jgi:hypothetical protein
VCLCVCVCDIHRYGKVKLINKELQNKHCDNAATNVNSENTRSRILASPARKHEYGVKEDESSNGHGCTAGFHHVTACSRLVGVLKLMNRLFL